MQLKVETRSHEIEIYLTRMHSSRMRTGRTLQYAGVCFPGGRCLLPGESCSGGGGVCFGGVVSAPGGMSVRGSVCSWGVCLGGSLLPGGVCSGGICSQGVSTLLWGGVVSQHALRQTPHPPVNRMTDRCKNITLATTSLRPVISTY